MKRPKAIRHRIEQKTALRKKARQRMRYLFRLRAKRQLAIPKAAEETK